MAGLGISPASGPYAMDTTVLAVKVDQVFFFRGCFSDKGSSSLYCACIVLAEPWMSWPLPSADARRVEICTPASSQTHLAGQQDTM